MQTVVAAIIESDGKLLVCQRRRGSNFELFWEFPGGKVKAGEGLEAALVRELEEELGISATIGPELYRTQHRYSGMTTSLEIIFFVARANPAEMVNRVFERIAWRTPESLPELNFLPADRELISRLATGELPLSG